MNRLIAFLLAIGLLAGCGGPAPEETEQPQLAQPVKEEPLASDFVVCIDNSRSIRGAEQTLIRETTMLLADLADPGDRVSVITFGKEARLAASALIRTDEDRRAFKDQVRQKVDFGENFSDIRLGIRLLAERKAELLRPTGSIPAVILLTDGKLEPADRNTKAAFEQLQKDLSGPLAQIAVYAVVLGDTTSNDTILPGINGKLLMEKHVARSPKRYFHARVLDQLLEIAILILNRTKGITSFGEKDRTEFKSDKYVDAMTLIVRKKSVDGKSLLESSDIRLEYPGATEPATVQNAVELFRGSDTSVYWSNDYQHFDLIVVKKPKPGPWRIRSAEGGVPETLSKIATSLELRSSARGHYFLNESSPLEAWLYDKKSLEESKQPFQIQARLAKDGELEQSQVYVNLRPAAGTGRYFLEVPAELDKALELGGAPATVAVQLVAQERAGPDSTELDPWFIRRSELISVQLVEPFVEWDLQKPRIPLMPARSPPMSFGATLDTAHAFYPDYEVHPRLTVSIERFDEESKAYQPYVKNALEGKADGTKLAYRFELPSPGRGAYRYRYRLDGVTRTAGSFAIESPWYSFRLQYGWLALAAGLALLGLAYWVSNRIVRLGGQVRKIRPEPKSLATLRRRVQNIEEDGVGFQLRARSFFLLGNRVKLKMLRGNATVAGERLSPAAKPKTLRARRDHKMTFTRKDGSEVEIKINARVRIF
jgi:hypothetical protein